MGLTLLAIISITGAIVCDWLSGRREETKSNAKKQKKQQKKQNKESKKNQKKGILNKLFKK